MFKYSIENTLQKKILKLKSKDKVLVQNFKKKFEEIIQQSLETILTYKNLKSPKNEFKRIHLTDNFILLFKVDFKENHITFVDICHWDKAYK